MMRYLLLSVLVIFAIGLFVVEDAFGESIIKEKECEIIGKELDSNIECRFVVGLSEGSSMSPPICDEGSVTCPDKRLRSPQYYDQELNILYFGHRITWMHDYIAVEMDNFTIVQQVQCEVITTGTYVETRTYPCELQIESTNDQAQEGRKASFRQYGEDVIFTEVMRYYDSNGFSWSKCWVALYDYDGKRIRWLDDYHNWGSNNTCSSTNLENIFAQQSKTTVPYIYYVVTSGEYYGGTAGAKGLGYGLHVIEGTGNFPDIHSYKTDKRCGGINCKIFLNEDKNELYYFVGSIMYQIKGMGEIESTPTSTAAVSEPVVEKVSEPVAEKVSEPIQKSSEGCGEGTVLVNGVCQLAPTQSKTTSMSIEPLYIIIGVVAIGGIIGAIAVAKRGSKTPKPAKQDLDEYEEQYLAKQKPSRKPAEKKETSSSCDNCGTPLKPTAKFCGSCGNQV